MKAVNAKKMKLQVIKIAPLSKVASGAQAQALSNSSCSRVCLTICSFNCTDLI
ncbi:hypothetical protein [Chitinophaga sp. Cy-1792]|uniref:hypothetical protein n=1 Tax=Chitinophaga sp. Cy-1792 TaxID=2608339 RepID=UPI00142322B4|nr:hypothetical protein [Chitinophaga sp. Cy-1792]